MTIGWLSSVLKHKKNKLLTSVRSPLGLRTLGLRTLGLRTLGLRTLGLRTLLYKIEQLIYSFLFISAHFC
jgi:hypothetical protein